MKISIIIPVLNEEGYIANVLDDIPPIDEIIVVDDGSTDNTYQIVNEYDVKLLRNKVNEGKGYSIKRGVEESSGDFLIFIDGDFQFDPSEIEFFLKYTDRDFILGSREDIGGVRKLTNRLSSLGVSLSKGEYFSDVLTGFRACKREVWNQLDLRYDDYRIDVEMVYEVLDKGFDITEIPVTARYNKEESNITFRDGTKITSFLMKKTLQKIFNLREQNG